MVRGRISTASYMIALLRRSLTLHSQITCKSTTLANTILSKYWLSTQRMQTCRQLLGYASQRVDKRQPFFLLTFNKYACVLQIYPKSPVNGGRIMQHSCRYHVVGIYAQSSNNTKRIRIVHNGNVIHRCWISSICIIL